MANPSRFRRGSKALSRLLLIVLGLGLLGFIHSSEYLSTMGASPSGARLERILKSPHFRDGVFQNLSETSVMVPGKSVKILAEFLALGGRRVPDAPLPTTPATRATFDAPPADDLRVTWLGHSTVLVEIEGQRVLFDPMWAERSSPSRWAGPKRFQPVPLPIDQVPELAAIAVSHDHYDHLDKAAIQTLAKAQPNVPFFVPLGVGAHLERWGVEPSRIHEHDWWEEDSAAGGKLKLVCAPSRHFSSRGLFDRNKTQWASWVLTGAAKRVYFGGDGGLDAAMADIGRRYGPFDLTMLEIGAFHENWGLIHLGPKNAMTAHRDLNGRLLMPIHWGTFNLGLHPWDEPIDQFLEAAKATGTSVVAPRIGEPFRPSAAPSSISAAPTRWWTAPTGS
ncbi:MAG TPA: MBL fold metallo-hydrolase [Myxococcales bacterium]|jgi:L-ascorbate metabolism protein UlaG (beta-lactamase superfamily)